MIWSPRPARRSRDRKAGLLLRARQSRQERYFRAGAGHVSPSNVIEAPDTGITPPIAGGEEALAATVSFSLEFFASHRAQFLTSGAGIDGATEVITTSAAHGFVNGDPVVYNAEDGVEDVGLTDGASYWVNAIAASTLSLHTSSSDAQSDTDRVDLTVSGAETHSLDKLFTRVYPAGTLLDTTEFQVTLSAVGSLELVGLVDGGITVDITDTTIPGGGQPPVGVHFVAVVFDPAGNRTGLYLDGDQIGQAASTTYTDWSSGTWEYMQGVVNAGTIGQLGVYPGFIPSTFVG